MQVISPSRSAPIEHPIRLVARFVDANAWPVHNSSDTEITVDISGRWSVYTVSFAVQEELEALVVNAILEVSIVPQQMDEARKVICGINKEMWLGNFDLDEEDRTVTFRYNLMFGGAGGATPEQVQDILELTLDECERAYPALYQISTGVVSAGTAVKSAMLETAGSA